MLLKGVSISEKDIGNNSLEFLCELHPAIVEIQLESMVISDTNIINIRDFCISLLKRRSFIINFHMPKGLKSKKPNEVSDYCKYFISKIFPIIPSRLVIHPFQTGNRSIFYDLMVELINRCHLLLLKNNIEMSFELLSYIEGGCESLINILIEADHKCFSAVIDLEHINYIATNSPIEILEKLTPLTNEIHFRDYDGKPFYNNKKRRYISLGDGKNDFALILSKLLSSDQEKFDFILETPWRDLQDLKLQYLFMEKIIKNSINYMK